MADIKISMKELLKLEFSDPKNALHKNKTEEDITYMGIYRKAHPTWSGWKTVDFYKVEDIELWSTICYSNKKLYNKVIEFYKTQFWDKMKLDQIKDQNMATELFVFAVNVGVLKAVQAAQKIIGVVADGIIGPITLGKLNTYDKLKFDVLFDLEEIKYYERIVAKRPEYKIYFNGWKNRAYTV